MIDAKDRRVYWIILGQPSIEVSELVLREKFEKRDNSWSKSQW
jgi:hypothetical protein